MPAKSLVVERRAQKQLLKPQPKIHKRIIDALTSIQNNPLIGDKLHGELAGYYKLRIGDYRIVYKFDPKSKIVIVVKIEHRQGIYK